MKKKKANWRGKSVEKMANKWKKNIEENDEIFFIFKNR